jgi:hypothetical protein
MFVYPVKKSLVQKLETFAKVHKHMKDESYFRYIRTIKKIINAFYE